MHTRPEDHDILHQNLTKGQKIVPNVSNTITKCTLNSCTRETLQNPGSKGSILQLPVKF